jgi:flagellar hook-associated protein 1 FlgK
MTSFFSSLETLSATPSDPSAQSAVLAAATQVAQSFSTTAGGLSQQQSSLLSQAQGVATELNSDLTQIASLNAQVAQANASGNPSPDLSDQLDSVVSSVSTLVGGSVVQDPSGSVTLYAAGAALVTGNQASSVAVSAGPSGAMQITVTDPGGTPTDVTSNVTAGTLGGLAQANVEVGQTTSQLDQLANGFATSVNAIQKAGYGSDGVTGRPLFTPPTQVAGSAANMSIDPSVAGQPNAIATATSAQDLPGGNGAVVALEGLANQSIGSGGSPSQWFGSITAQIGNAADSASTDAATRAETVTQAQNLNSSASGVSLTQESVNMTQFQQAFEAATQVLTVASNLLGEFISSVGATTA